MFQVVVEVCGAATVVFVMVVIPLRDRSLKIIHRYHSYRYRYRYICAVAFDARHRERGVRAAAVHPGIIQTELTRHVDPSWLRARVDQINQQRRDAGKPPLQQKTISQGAATSVWAGVVAPAAEVGGWYCEKCHVAEIVQDEVPTSAMSEGVRAYAVDRNASEALWKKSEGMVGEWL